MSRLAFLSTAIVFLVLSAVVAQESQTIEFTGIVDGSTLKVKAVRQGDKFTGTGTLTAANGASYEMAVKTGSVRGDDIQLQGTIGPAGAAARISFTLLGNVSTKAIEFSYVGSSGKLITQTAKGAVVVK